MSYILGALKKAEKDRRRERSLDLNDWDQENWDNPAAKTKENHLLLWFVMIILLLLILIIGWLAYQVMGQGSGANLAQDSQPQYQAQLQSSPVTSQPPSTQVRESQNTQIVQTVQSASVAVSQELPEFTGHIYFAGNSHLSRVFAGSITYREGDLVSGYRIEQILESELVLSRAGEETRIELKR